VLTVTVGAGFSAAIASVPANKNAPMAENADFIDPPCKVPTILREGALSGEARDL
jgi:hypothetical protein